VERVGRIEEAEVGAARAGTWPEKADFGRAGGESIDASPVARQQPLPIPWQLVRAVDEFGERDFAHPAELHFARILSFYRIRWSYEPTTFPLAYSDEGRPSEMFTPDFYLPEHKLYIELTTMRQRLVTRKNRKIRRLRELYPNIRIKLLYRRDCDRLGDAYRLPPPDPSTYREGHVLFDEDRIGARIAELAAAIAAEPHGTESLDRFSSPLVSRGVPRLPASGQELTAVHLPIWPPTGAAETFDRIHMPVTSAAATANDPALLVLGVDRGSAVFAQHLSSALEERGLAIDRDRVTLTRHRSPQGERRVRIARPPRTLVAGRRILVVTDVVSTGLSLAYLTWWLQRRGARQVEICTLLDRQAARLIEVPVRYVGFEAPNELLVGFGLHLRRQFRNLPYIASLVSAPQPETAG
jgi:hypoxanthine phosphoribosyltransferase